jgi:hypothetical protein
MTSPVPINDVDRAAFERAIEIAGRDPRQRRRFDAWFAKGESYENVGRAAAYHCQIEKLGLMPWNDPPMYAFLRRGDERYVRANMELLERLLDAGLSRFEPDVVNALHPAPAGRPGVSGS